MHGRGGESRSPGDRVRRGPQRHLGPWQKCQPVENGGGEQMPVLAVVSLRAGDAGRVLDESPHAHAGQGTGAAASDAHPAPDSDPPAEGSHVVTEHSQLAVSRPGDASEQVDECCCLARVIDHDAQGGAAGHGRPDAEARSAHGPAAPATHPDAGCDHGIRANDGTTGPQIFPRI